MNYDYSVHKGHRKRMRERFARSGFGFYNFRSHEIFEMMLFYALPLRDTNELAHSLLKRYGTILNTVCAPVSELCNFKFLGEKSVLNLKIFAAVFAYLEDGNSSNSTKIGTDKTTNFKTYSEAKGFCFRRFADNNYSFDNMDDTEILYITLYILFKSKKLLSKKSAKRLIERFGGFSGLIFAENKELKKAQLSDENIFKIRFLAALYYYFVYESFLRSSDDYDTRIGKYIMHVLKYETDNHAYAIKLDEKNFPLFEKTVMTKVNFDDNSSAAEERFASFARTATDGCNYILIYKQIGSDFSVSYFNTCMIYFPILVS